MERVTISTPRLSSEFAEAVAAQVVEAAREVILPRFHEPRINLGVREKALGEIVCDVDFLMEARLSQSLRRLLPEARVASEESPDPRAAFEDAIKRGPFWIIDPLDGTSAFLRQQETFGVA